MNSEFKTRVEIAREYGITVKTLNNRIEAENLKIPHGKRLSPKDVALIYATFGKPSGG